MKASEAFEKLKQAINIDFYIGSKASALIEAACKEPEVAKAAKKPALKKLSKEGEK